MAVSRRLFGSMAAGLAAAWWVRPPHGRWYGYDAWREAARRIGEHHLRSLPAGDRRRASEGRVPLPSSVVALRRRIADDYANGRTIDVNGWLLSRTELALCLREAGV